MGIQDRKLREKGARRELILAAAKSVFAEKGLGETTIDDIAHRAELGKGTIYLYFASRDEILAALKQEGLARLARRFRQAIDPERPADENLRRLCDAYFRFSREEPESYWVLYFSSPAKGTGTPAHDAAVREGSECIRLVAQVVEQGIQAGLFSAGIDPMETAVILWSASSGIIFVCEREIGPAKLMHYQTQPLLRSQTELLLRALKARE
jgi:AcrR family transcriptional regulator